MSIPKQETSAISPKRDEDYSEWYQQVIKAADLADNSPVRGCMVIKPYGYALWENIQSVLDKMFKKTGHKNAYFPLFIPLSSFEKEAKHVSGFAKECAVVTHSRLKIDETGKLDIDPASRLEEPLIVRPTSELVIGEMFSKWVQSYRDLPLLINQWCNVVRWEMRTRLFLRSTEFLWQEGHTVHADREEAVAETLMILGLYAKFLEEYLAMPAFKGRKTESERFPGADETYCIEPMMQDRKAIQVCTSHFLGQNFSKACDIQFLDKEGKRSYAWTTSWGMTTRTIGSLVMTHGDNNGLVVPPKIAPTHLMIVPVIHKEEMKEAVMNYCLALKESLEALNYAGQPLRIELDSRDLRSSEKMWQTIKKGVPLWVEVGPREVESQSVVLGYRDKGPKEKITISQETLLSQVSQELAALQQRLYDKALAFKNRHTVKIDSKEAFYAFFTPQNTQKPEIHGGFALAHWNGSSAVEEQVKADLKVSIRCIPLDDIDGPGVCIFTGQPSQCRVVFAKAY
jgi:prolyl-tRNA synthetase